MTNPITLQLRQGTPAHAVAGVHDLDGRPVMLIRAEDPEHRGALTPDDGDTLTTAATMALDKSSLSSCSSRHQVPMPTMGSRR